MNSTQELRVLLRELIEIWPDDHFNPIVEEARSFLHNTTLQSDGAPSSWDHLSADDYYTELWYSL